MAIIVQLYCTPPEADKRGPLFAKPRPSLEATVATASGGGAYRRSHSRFIEAAGLA
jgi:hypothetical protein